MKISTILNNKIVRKILIIILWLMVWEVSARIIDAQVYFPSFSSTIRALITLVADTTFYSSVLMSVFRVLFGFLLGVIIGIVLGIACGFNSFIYDLFNPIMVVIKSTPVISFIILALVWFNSGFVPIFICLLMIVPIVWTNIVVGIKNIDPHLIEVCKIYKISRKNYITKVVMKSLKPYMVAALLASLGFGWKVTVAAEVLSHPTISIGTNLYNAKIYLETDYLFAWTLCVILLSFVFEYAIKRILKNKGDR